MLVPDTDRPSTETVAMALGKPERLVLLVLTLLFGACADCADPSTGSAWTLWDDAGSQDADLYRDRDAVPAVTDVSPDIAVEAECSLYYEPGLAGLANVSHHGRSGERFCAGDSLHEVHADLEQWLLYATDTGEDCCDFPIYDIAVPSSKVTALSYNAPPPPPRSETEGCAVSRRFDPECHVCFESFDFEWKFYVEFAVTNLGDQPDYVDCSVYVDGPIVGERRGTFYVLLRDEFFAPGETRQVSETLTYPHFQCAVDVGVSCKGENEPRVLNVFPFADVPEDWRNQRIHALDPPLHD